MNPASVERKEIIGLHRITKKVLRNLCKKHQLYQTPELNDVLYLHYQGFQFIECLEEYTELKCLWLECNAISEIQGLENQTKLKCLFLQNNLIKNIENLEHCKELDTLNLASNHIRKIENCGVDILPVLNTLNLSSNCLRDSESLRGLEECKTLSVLDLANNRIDDILVVKVFAKMPQLRVLVLQGNPVVSKIPQYRKTLILECQELTYLDSRPVFPKDRACAEAWKRGGYNEERKEQERWNRRDRKKIRDSVNATIRMRNKHKSADEQMDLITSSDSETDEKRRKEAKDRRTESADPRLLIETGEEVNEQETLLEIWDEVSGQAGMVKKVENLVEVEEAAEKQAAVALEVEPTTTTTQDEPTEKLEISAKVNVADILKMVEKPMLEEDELPELVSDADTVATEKCALIEEINVGTTNETKVVADSNEGEETEITAENQEKKRLFIEVVNDATDDQLHSDSQLNDEQTTLTAKEAKNELLEFSEKYLLAEEDKKPLWVDEIFSQSFVATPTQKLQANNHTDDVQLISNEIEKEIKQGAIKKRRPLIMEATTSNVGGDFFKPVEKTQFRAEFDLNFDELDAPEPESADISDFEDVNCTSGNIYEKVYAKFLAPKIKTEETKKTEFLEFTEGKQSYFKLTANVDETSVTTETTNGQGLLLEEIDVVNEGQKAAKDVKTKKLLTSLIEEIDEVVETCEARGLMSEEMKAPKQLKTSVEYALAEDVPESDFDKLNLLSENIERAVKQFQQDYSLPIEEVQALEEVLQRPVLLKTAEVEDALDSAKIHNADVLGEEAVENEATKKTTLNDLETDSLSNAGYDTDSSELSNASDDLVSVTSSSENENSTFNKYAAPKPLLDAYKKVDTSYAYEKSSTSSESEDEITKSQYNDAANAICDAVMSRVGAHEQPMPEKISFSATTNDSTEISIGNYEPESEMDEILARLPDDEAATRAKRLAPDDDDDDDEVLEAETHMKSEEEIKYEVECEEVNQQVTKDFESLNANMEFLIDQLQQEQAEIKGDFAKKVDEITNEVQQHALSNQIAFQDIDLAYEEKDSLELRTNEKITQGCGEVLYETISTMHTTVSYESGERSLETPNCEIEYTKEFTKIEAEIIIEVDKNMSVTTLETENKIQLNDETVLNDKEDIVADEQIKRFDFEKPEVSIDNIELIKASGDHVGIGEATVKYPFLQLEEILERPTLKAYEKEAAELKSLLHKLEQQNEKLTFVKKTCDELLLGGTEVNATDSEEENTEDSYHDAAECLENEAEMVNAVINEMVADAVDKGVETAKVEKPKNYVITDLESDEEYSYSEPPKPADPPVKSIQSVLGAFHKLIQDIATRNRAENQRTHFECESKRKPTSEKAKLESLQTLLETPQLIEHHKDTYEELKPRVDAVKARNQDELKQMVERVYAQKDKYDDSLELVDGRLVVIKKETGEMEEVTVAKTEVYGGSDESTEEYESAHSSNEGETESSKQEAKNLIWDFSMGAKTPHTYVPKYRPTMRKSAEQLVLDAFESNEQLCTEQLDDDEVDEDDDEEAGAKTLRTTASKTSVFSNIDEEFFKNLDFKQIAEESAKDENFVEIARSYEDLKKIIKKSGLETTRSTLTNEEQDIVEMFEDNKELKAECSAAENNEEQADLMHKLVQRTKEALESGEEALETTTESTDKAYVIDAALEHTKQYSDSDQETLIDEVASNTTLTFEADYPAEYSKHIKVVKMLKKLQTDDPIAQDLLQSRKAPDFGDFTAELDPEAASMGDEVSVELAQADYAKKLADYKETKMQKQLNISSTEVAIQCEPASFAVKLASDFSQSTENDIQIESTRFDATK